MRGDRMNEAGHRAAVEDIRRARAKLDPEEDVRAYVELTHGMTIHDVAAGILRRHGVDFDRHQGMMNWLKNNGYPTVSKAFSDIENVRTGRWYGRQGNG